MTDAGSVSIDDRGGYLVVVNRNGARRNPLSPALYQAIQDAVARAAAEDRIGSVILTGEGGFFCAGGDLKMLATRRAMPEAARRGAVDGLHDVIRAIRACPKPVIASVEGGAAGAGVSLAFACDLILAARGAVFTVAYVKAGLVPDGGLTSRLATQLPHALAARLCLLGDPISAERLHELGVLTDLCEAGTALDMALSLADRISAGPAQAMSAIKALLESAAHSSLEDQLDRERDAMAKALGSDEAAEGIAAFLDKRVPDFAKLRRE